MMLDTLGDKFNVPLTYLKLFAEEIFFHPRQWLHTDSLSEIQEQRESSSKRSLSKERLSFSGQSIPSSLSASVTARKQGGCVFQ